MRKRYLFILSAALLLAGLLLAFFFFARIFPAGSGHPAQIEYGVPIKVLRVIDGDTVELANGERLRYIGMDTPEEVDPRKPLQCFAREAAAENKALVEGKMVTFYKDISGRDRYGRLLGFVYLADGTFVNLELVKDGFAFSYPYPPDTSKAGEFGAAEAQARAKNLGLWAACTVTHTSSDRSQTNAVE